MSSIFFHNRVFRTCTEGIRPHFVFSTFMTIISSQQFWKTEVTFSANRLMGLSWFNLFQFNCFSITHHVIRIKAIDVICTVECSFMLNRIVTALWCYHLQPHSSQQRTDIVWLDKSTFKATSVNLAYDRLNFVSILFFLMILLSVLVHFYRMFSFNRRICM